MAADEGQVVRVAPDALRKGGYAFIRGNPCRVAELEHLAKATANGNKRLRLRGPHVFTGKVYEDTLNLTAGFHGIDVPLTSKAAYGLLDCDADTGFLSLLTDSGDCKEDVGLVRNAEDGMFDEMGAEVLRRFQAGEALRLMVLSLLGKEVVVGVDVDPC
uniref:Translation initiation factor 5A C-terminal domain-containing protein n=1 Tax=Mantoniella antarctica TaxID=81844 RepID=A0A7S0SPD9_9CHLO|mmetsp:Transcript_31063/g.77813  ORF Transcript_31063/g.77813 Transcript_31063/m.77813 type:complete len:159 (+) Transcript_31063:157-633(+)|eukprot:CAMPEP_0181350456 /NCGR_PEP_ID=MMETSP1106-20121128/1274_1 /TAXON_ID=81844 /ORGANISM="Mantoniella antarctica, Strain SL-175" /LENGTH=158 /DNA_ID=CAMNT_0023462927 /DNA_START=58 /DNA_END=534 /DNA_ORIENTATION=+